MEGWGKKTSFPILTSSSATSFSLLCSAAAPAACTGKVSMSEGRVEGSIGRERVEHRVRSGLWCYPGTMAHRGYSSFSSNFNLQKMASSEKAEQGQGKGDGEDAKEAEVEQLRENEGEQPRENEAADDLVGQDKKYPGFGMVGACF